MLGSPSIDAQALTQGLTIFELTFVATYAERHKISQADVIRRAVAAGLPRLAQDDNLMVFSMGLAEEGTIDQSAELP
jgi:hypothetical protein